MVAKDIKNNQLVVGHIDDDKLYNKSVQISELHWLGKKYPLPLKAQGQIRYRQPAQDLTLYPDKAEFKKAQQGVASGQTLAVYNKNELIASATII